MLDLTRNHKTLVFFAALLNFIVGIAVGFHHHAIGDGRHSDCPVCATGSQLSAGDSDRQVGNTPIVHSSVTRLFQPGEASPIVPSLDTIHAPRAPPAALTM